MLKRQISIYAVLGMALAMFGAGCGKTTQQAVQQPGACSKTDYAVTDLALDNPTTTFSDANAVLTTVKRMGDCDTKNFQITLTDNGSVFFTSDIKSPNESNGLFNDWVAATEGEHTIKAVIVLDQDADPSNNVKEIKFNVAPIGFEAGANDKAIQTVSANAWAAHAFLVSHAVGVKSVWGEFKKTGGQGELVAQIRKDAGGHPGEVVAEGKTTDMATVFTTTTTDFKWVGVNVETLLQPGIYWVAFKVDGKATFDWRGTDNNVYGPIDDTQHVTVNGDAKPQDKDWQSRTGDLSFRVSALKVGATMAEQPVGLANPASVNCIEKGGKLQMEKRGELGDVGG